MLLALSQWGAAAKALSVLAAEAAEIQAQIDGANANEEEAKQAWLAKLDVPSWGKMTEEQAKKKWLAKLDAPVWQGKVTPTAQNKAAQSALF